MMNAIDGRVDCRMTEKIQGVNEYYETLNALDTPTTLSGRVTAQLELAQDGEFQSTDSAVFGKEGFSKKTDAEAYSVVVDTKGTLLWSQPKELTLPLIVITSEHVKKAYLDYLDSENISWIAVGKERINLPRACEILAEEFGVKRMAIVGGMTTGGLLMLISPLIVRFAPLSETAAEYLQYDSVSTAVLYHPDLNGASYLVFRLQEELLNGIVSYHSLFTTMEQ